MVLDGKKVNIELLDEIKQEVKKYLIKPCLAVIQIGEDAATDSYVKSKEKACNETGIYFKLLKYDENVLETEIVNKIIELNNDDYVNGIILQLPIPSYLNTYKLTNLISKSKDVDGLTDSSIAKFYNDRKGFLPCTPKGILYLLKYYNIELAGKNVVVVGRGKLVGKPIANLLINEDCTVTVCHSKTVDLKSFTKNADIIITATGIKDLITEDMIKDGVVIVDAGIVRVDNKLYGDVDYEKVSKKASFITPVPGGVGPLTVAMLLQNVILSYEKSNKN